MLTNENFYNIAIDLKKHAEDRRDDINKYYISLFSIIVSIIPFVGTIQEFMPLKLFSRYNINLLAVILSIIGICLTVSWIRVLKDLYAYIKGLEEFLKKLEEKDNNKIFTYLTNNLYSSEDPSKITKHEMWVPYCFMIIFMVVLMTALFNFDI